MSDEKKVTGEDIAEEVAENKEAVPPEEAAETDAEKEDKEKVKKKKLKKLESELLAKEKEVAELEEKLKECEDRYLRVLAEYDNFRKRSAKEKDSLYADACADSLKELLPVLDTLERAAVAEGDAEKLHVGIEMTLKCFTDALTKLKVTEMDCLGKTFDPNLQNAVMHIDDESCGENEVVEVLMKGYERDGRVIRHAMVKVAN